MLSAPDEQNARRRRGVAKGPASHATIASTITIVRTAAALAWMSTVTLPKRMAANVGGNTAGLRAEMKKILPVARPARMSAIVIARAMIGAS